MLLNFWRSGQKVSGDEMCPVLVHTNPQNPIANKLPVVKIFGGERGFFVSHVCFSRASKRDPSLRGGLACSNNRRTLYYVFYVRKHILSVYFVGVVMKCVQSGSPPTPKTLKKLVVGCFRTGISVFGTFSVFHGNRLRS